MTRKHLLAFLLVALAATALTGCQPKPWADADMDKSAAKPATEKPLPEPADAQREQPIDPEFSKVGFPYPPFPGARRIGIADAQGYAELERPRTSMNQEKHLIPQLEIAAANPAVEVFELWYVEKPVGEVFEWYASRELHDPTHDEDYHKWNHWMAQVTLEKRRELGIEPWRVDTAMLIDLDGKATLVNHTRVWQTVVEHEDGQSFVHSPPSLDFMPPREVFPPPESRETSPAEENGE